MKKWLIGAVSSVVAIPLLVMSWGRVQDIWANPIKTEEVAKKVDKQAETQDQIAKLVLEQKARQDTSEAVQKVNMEALKGQLDLIAELKAKKR